MFNNIIFHEHPKKFDHKSFVAKYMLGLLGCCVSVHPVLLNHRVVTRTWSATNSDILRRWEVIYVLVLILLSKSLIFLNVHYYLYVQYKIEDRYLRKMSNQRTFNFVALRITRYIIWCRSPFLRISHQSLHISIAAAAHDLTIIMAVFSALKNKKNQKMREGIEDLVTKCSEAAEKDDVNVQVSR